MQVRDDNLHQEDSILTYKVAIPSIGNILNKTIITSDVYEKYSSNFYDDRYVEFYDLDFFVKQNLDELEHPSLISEWPGNVENLIIRNSQGIKHTHAHRYTYKHIYI